ncbi:2,3-diaminopropionate biosynthesis protein SbnA [Fulvivirga sediminis]|uniref:N-(2-amino-2-carboxyethyl)-L-glutamate synthase n=1 Tax=Fulvivirga sediminis TaxID=2803949 RepID=A0A937FD29_9BACT|nr:2,3-diaminopropionate biosynthesis protein SbnA [Fulvivirga sediminis]MBL3658318.1 2,3-diaminopropionate biosynthesis protein SbnA [Fulvivirga sediminis]
MNNTQHNIHPNVLATIGNTPMIHLMNLCPEFNVNIYGKMEAFNPGGSIKDRTATNILVDAINKGEINKDTTIVESSSGNMAIGLAQTCLMYGLKLVVVVDPLINKHTLKILKTYGAKIEQVTEQENGSYLNARLKKVENLLKVVENSFWPNQYANHANPEAHYNTMREIAEALNNQVDYLFAATSTCGTIMGCAEYLKKHNLKTKIVAVDAMGSVLFGQAPGKRLIPGHGAGRPSILIDKSYIDEVVHITDQECIEGCHQLLQREAILAGGSSGAVVSALQKLVPSLPSNANCAIILCDRGERYLDTIYSTEWVNQNFPESNTLLKQQTLSHQWA